MSSRWPSHLSQSGGDKPLWVGSAMGVFCAAGRAFSLLLLGLPLFCNGADWPQYRGPNHDGVSVERINKQWTGSVTNPVWRIFLTNGLTSLTVSGGRAFTQVASDYDVDG